MPFNLNTQVSELANQLKTAVLSEVPNTQLSTEQSAILQQAVETLAEVSLRLPMADETTRFTLQSKALLSASSVEDVLAAKLQDASAAAERVRTKLITLSTAFVTKLVEVGLTAAIAAA